MDDVVLMSDPRVTGIPVAGDGAALVDVTGSLPVDQRKADTTGAWRLLRGRCSSGWSTRRNGCRATCGWWSSRGTGRRRSRRRTSRATGSGCAPRTRPCRTRSCTGSRAATSRRRRSRRTRPGAAVDVTLRGVDDVELDLGCPVNASPEQSDGRCYTAHPDVVGEPLLLRRTLAAALEGAGLVNYPTEWWHWSYGDRYWAYATGAERALYGPLAAG